MSPERPERTVWKFAFDVDDRVTIEVPYGAVLLHAGLDPANESWLALWYEVNTSAPKVSTRIAIHGTGHPIKTSERWLASVRQGSFMWHLYAAPLAEGETQP